MNAPTKEKIVRSMAEVENAVTGMNEAMKKTPERELERTSKINEFKKKFPEALYLEPITRISTAGTKHPEWEKQRDHLHEYVVGVFESQMINGKLEFFLTGLPGDDYCKWSIPVNKPIGVPRFVALHLSKNLGWKEMKPLTAAQGLPTFEAGDEINAFANFEFKKRGHFHPINAY
jgi:hypothetical protein